MNKPTVVVVDNDTKVLSEQAEAYAVATQRVFDLRASGISFMLNAFGSMVALGNVSDDDMSDEEFRQKMRAMLKHYDEQTDIMVEQLNEVEDEAKKMTEALRNKITEVNLDSIDKQAEGGELDEAKLALSKFVGGSNATH